jgi:hypothetical protein
MVENQETNPGDQRLSTSNTLVLQLWSSSYTLDGLLYYLIYLRGSFAAIGMHCEFSFDALSISPPFTHLFASLNVL